MSSAKPPGPIDERTLDVIVERVVDALHGRLEEIAADLPAAPRGADTERQLTVEDVAERFGVARSTVYAHWREWGGYKLGPTDKAPIRFDDAGLPGTRSGPEPPAAGPPRSAHAIGRNARKRRKRRDLVADKPRFDQPLTELD